jgi:hypothetical protein
MSDKQWAYITDPMVKSRRFLKGLKNLFPSLTRTGALILSAFSSENRDFF